MRIDDSRAPFCSLPDWDLHEFLAERPFGEGVGRRQRGFLGWARATSASMDERINGLTTIEWTMPIVEGCTNLRVDLIPSGRSLLSTG